MTTENLPPGQRFINEFPRFGLLPFARRIPDDAQLLTLTVGGDVDNCVDLSSDLQRLPRVEQTSDFHCVTTWSNRALQWSGYRFRDFYSTLVLPEARPHPDATFVVFRSLDGYCAGLKLRDLLAYDVLLADQLEGAPLPVRHGAPLRLIAPALYGYKNPKHLKAIEFWRDARHYRPSGYWFMDHPRARVAYEERGRGLPGWVYRYLYRPLVKPTIKRFKAAWDQRSSSQTTREKSGPGKGS